MNKTRSIRMLAASLSLCLGAGALGCNADDDDGNANNTTTPITTPTTTNNTQGTTNNTQGTTTPMTSPDPTCDNYCDAVMTNCTGENAQYGDREECMAYCGDVGNWAVGEPGATEGNSIACRLYHGSAPSAAMPDTHCSHAGPSGGDMCGSWCDVYCTLGFAHCSGPNQLYPDQAACDAACGTFSEEGGALDTQYDTVQCRIYHLGAPSAAMPDTHCSHGAVEATAFCVGSPADFAFRTEAPSSYTRVDRAGMPAVSTALITDKAGYNDQDPIDDAAGDNPYVGEIVANLTAVHDALDDDIMGVGLTPCSMTQTVNGLPQCVGQTVGAGGPIVATLVLPDHLSLDPSAPAGFPNGRRLADPVIDITLAVILLDLSVHAPDALVGVLNPPTNDKGVEGVFLTSFPYLHAPHMAP